MNLGRYLFEVVRDMRWSWYLVVVAVLSVLVFGSLSLAFGDVQDVPDGTVAVTTDPVGHLWACDRSVNGAWVRCFDDVPTNLEASDSIHVGWQMRYTYP